jgi:hypothetical protein
VAKRDAVEATRHGRRAGRIAWPQGAKPAVSNGILAAVPVIARIGAYRFFFFSNESDEPPHVHVQRERMLAKFWLDEVALAESKRFAAHELRTIEKIVSERREQFLEAWHEFFR